MRSFHTLLKEHNTAVLAERPSPDRVRIPLNGRDGQLPRNYAILHGTCPRATCTLGVLQLDICDAPSTRWWVARTARAAPGMFQGAEPSRIASACSIATSATSPRCTPDKMCVAT